MMVIYTANLMHENQSEGLRPKCNDNTDFRQLIITPVSDFWLNRVEGQVLFLVASVVCVRVCE